MTNYERIKQMSIEELADFLDQVTYCCEGANCGRCPLTNACIRIKEWLESEADE